MENEYREWAKYHLTLFGLIGTAGAAETVNAWRKRFEAKGFTPTELRDASDSMADDPPRFLSDHLGAIQAHVQGRRDAVRVREEMRRRREERSGSVPPPADWNVRGN